MAKRILVVDDDENILNLEKTILEQKGFELKPQTIRHRFRCRACGSWSTHRPKK